MRPIFQQSFTTITSFYEHTIAQIISTPKGINAARISVSNVKSQSDKNAKWKKIKESVKQTNALATSRCLLQSRWTAKFVRYSVPLYNENIFVEAIREQLGEITYVVFWEHYFLDIITFPRLCFAHF